jgi:hypothetical protein
LSRAICLPKLMVSERAKQYLATLEREPAIIDEEQVIAAMERAKLPVFEPVVQFQIDYGGYIEWYGFNDFHWGILHHKPEPESFLTANEIAFDSEDGEYFITCADCHLSDHWTLDSKGSLYWCGYFKASSFDLKIERDAFVASLGMLGKRSRLQFDAEAKEVIEILTPRLHENLIAEASDNYQALYLKDNLYVAVDFKHGDLMAFLFGEETPAVLRDLSFHRKA